MQGDQLGLEGSDLFAEVFPGFSAGGIGESIHLWDQLPTRIGKHGGEGRERKKRTTMRGRHLLKLFQAQTFETSIRWVSQRREIRFPPIYLLYLHDLASSNK